MSHDPAGSLYPHSSSSSARLRVTTGTTLYLRSDSLRAHSEYAMPSTVSRVGSPSCLPNVSSASCRSCGQGGWRCDA